MPICRSCFCLHIHLLASDWTLTQSLLLLTSVTAGMGQAPFWVAVIGGLTIIKTIRQVAEGGGVLPTQEGRTKSLQGKGEEEEDPEATRQSCEVNDPRCIKKAKVQE